MASPQPDKYTRISNELIEALCRFSLTGPEWRIILFLIRMTYGYHRKVVNLTIKEIAFGTNMDKSNVIRTLKRLLWSKIIKRGQSDYKTTSSYSIQKDYDHWKSKPKKKKRVVNLTTKSCQLDHKSEILPSSIKEKRKDLNKGSKNSLPKIETLKHKNPWLDLKLWSDFREHRKSLKKYPFTSLAETKAINQLKTLVDKGYSQKELIDASIINCWRGIFEPFKKQEENFELGDF